jgi:PKD repeat protein
MIRNMHYVSAVGIIFSLMLSVNVLSQADFTASVTVGCTPLGVKFEIDPSTVDMDTIEVIDWHFGFGDTITGIDPDTVVYGEEGVYTVSMVINNYFSDRVVQANYITVHRTVDAAFRYEEYASNYNYRFIPLDEITDASATYFYMWRYNELTGSDSRSNDYVVDMSTQYNAIDTVTLDTGSYSVMLRIEDTYGCSSRSELIVQVSAEIQVPNVYAPASGNFYIIDPQNLNTVLDFELYNRYGQLVFSQVAPIINWNGQTNSGQDLGTGVYFYLLKSVGGDPADKYNQNGFIHLYR